MDTYNQVLQRVFVEFPEKISDSASSAEVGTNDAEVARSENNVLQWMTYLPEDCIRTMIQMGWDVTT
jgi:hypothetical protein